MKVVLESTEKIVNLVIDGVDVPARIWEGHTEAGVPCHAYVTRIAAHEGADLSQFEAELESHRIPSADIEAIPLRLII